MPPYSTSLKGSIPGPKNPWRRRSSDLADTLVRTYSQYGWSNGSAGSVSLPFLTQNARQETIGGPSKKDVPVLRGTGNSAPWWLPRMKPPT